MFPEVGQAARARMGGHEHHFIEHDFMEFEWIENRYEPRQKEAGSDLFASRTGYLPSILFG
jgi:hypothetical protein